MYKNVAFLYKIKIIILVMFVVTGIYQWNFVKDKIKKNWDSKHYTDTVINLNIH